MSYAPSLLSLGRGRITRLRRVVGLTVLTGLSSVCAPLAAALTPARSADVVDSAAALIRAHHFDTQQAQHIAEELQQWRDAPGAADSELLAQALTERLRAISGDKHFRVLPDPDAATSVPAGAAAPAPVVDSGIVAARVGADGIGYLGLSHFPPDSAQSRAAYAAAMARLAGAQALVIDVRANRGGDPASVAELLGYLFQRPAFVSMDFMARGSIATQNTIRSDRPGLHLSEQLPIAVLTSATTFSGGEALAYDLQAYQRAVIVGETSGGAANPTRLLELPAGLALSVPYLSPRHRVTQTNWEGRGVVPDVACTAEVAPARARALLRQRLSAHAVAAGNARTAPAAVDRSGQ